MVNNQDTLFREVDEELRREQLKRLWDKYGTYIIAAVAAILLGVGGVKWWQASNLAAAQAAGARYQQALEQTASGNADDGRKALQQIAKGSAEGYAAMAQLALAGDAAKAGKTDDALASYEAVAAKSGLDPLIRDFARLQVTALKVDTADFTEVQNRLKDLSMDTNPWRFAARELTGMAALHSGKLDEARKVLEPLVTDAFAPQGVRERSGALMAMVVESELERAAAATASEAKPAEPTAKTDTAPAKEEPAADKQKKKKQ
jgi:hypothetical protein